MELFDIYHDIKTTNPVLLKLIKDSGEFIIFDEVVDKSGKQVSGLNSKL